MRDAQAEQNAAKYWTYFEYALGLVISQLDFHLRGEIQEDYATLQAAILRVMSSKATHDQTKQTVINRLKEDFANAHRFYIMQALNRVGVVKVEDEGVIDFESIDIDTMTKIVRDTSNTTVLAAAKAQDGKSTPPLIKPEMVMVYKDKQLMAMPKEDFEKFHKENKEDEGTMIMAEAPDELDIEQGEEIDVPEEEQKQEPKKKFGWRENNDTKLL